MQKITLNNPITVDKVSMSELTVRRPKVRDYLAIENLEDSHLAREVTLIANLASVTIEAIKELDIGDYVKARDALKDFFSITIIKNLRLEILTLSSIVGGGIEQILDMEMNEFILWYKAAEEIKCQFH